MVLRSKYEVLSSKNYWHGSIEEMERIQLYIYLAPSRLLGSEIGRSTCQRHCE